MPRNQKDSQGREIEDEEQDTADAPRVDESEVEEDERARASLDKSDPREEREPDDEEDDDLAEELRLDDLSAMEGPDA